MKRFYLLVLVATLSSMRFVASAQTDTAFWFVAPYVSIGDGNDLDRPINFCLATYSQPSTVTISEPANPSFTPIVVNLAANSSTLVDVTAELTSVENTPPDSVLNYGIYIKATNNITAYYQVLGGVGCDWCNPEAFSLKGHNALGTTFYTPFQQTYANSNSYFPYPYSAFDIVSPQDSTQVTITPTKNIVGHNAGTPFTITLNKGQTFSCTATSETDTDHPSGSLVTSNKPVAVTVKDDLIQISGQDLEGDQLIPVNVIGDEYIVVKAPVSVNDLAIIVGTQNGTQVSVNGTVVATINAGQTYQYALNSSGDGADYITSTLPIYVYQLTTSDGEAGAAILPPLTCTGSSDVCVTRATPQEFYIFLITQNGNQDNFLCNGSATEITSSQFTAVPGTDGNWVYDVIDLSNFITTNSACRVINSSGLFAMAELFGVSAGSSYAYFSNFVTLSNPVIPVNICGPGSGTLKPTVSGTHVWNTGSSADSITVTQAGTYWVQNNLTGGCIITDTFKVATSSLPVVNVTPSNSAICKGKSILLTANSDSLTYQWSPMSGLSATSGSSVTANPTATTTYTITGINSIGCTVSVKDTVVVDSTPVLSITPKSSTLCSGQSSLLTVKGSTSYQWNPSTGLSSTSGSSVIAAPTISTTYTVISPISVCADTAQTQVAITVNPTPVLTLSSAPAFLCYGQSVSLIVSGATSYKWSPSTALSSTTNSSIQATPAITTTYTIIGTSSGCSDTSTVPIRVIQDSLKVSTSNFTVCQGSPVVITATGAANYVWSPSTGLNTATGDTVTATPTLTTSYTLAASGINGCPDTISPVVVNVNLPPVVLILPLSPQICIGQSIPLTVSGASVYRWSPSTGLSQTNGSSIIAKPTSTTIYTAYGTDVAGCIDSAEVLLKVNPLPIITIAPPDSAICRGSSATLTASGASTYVWSPSSGLNSTISSTVIANPTTTTTYRVNGTDSLGCIDSTNITIRVVQDSLKVSTNNTSVCRGNSVVLTASGANSYDWSPSTGLNKTNSDTVTAAPFSTTSYTLIATGAIGCLDTENVVVNVNPPPVLTIAPATPQICIGHPVPLSVSGALTYTWSPSTGLNQTSGSAISANPTATTTYTTYGIDVHGCNDSANVVVKVNPLPIVTLLPTDTLICHGLSVPLTANGVSSYQWNPSYGLSSTTGSTAVADPTITTTYTVYGTDALGCTDTVTTTVNIILNSINLSLLPNSATICLGNSVAITASGGINYEWSPSAGLTTTTGSSTTASPVSNTTYNVIGVGVGSCADTTDVLIIVIPPPVITVKPDSPVICDGQAISLTASGASNYEWSPSTGLYETTGSTVDAHSNVTTTYTVYGTDSIGCIDSTKFSLDVNSAPIGAFTAAGVPSVCNPLQIQFNNTTTGGISYLWSFGDGDSSTEQNPVHTFQKNGIYTITLIATSQNGCIDTVTVSDTLTNSNVGLFIPNSFTPSMPGVNQLFRPNVECIAPTGYTFRVYDRWGMLMYETTDLSAGWDGTCKGKPQPLDTYVYYVQMTCGACNFFKKGNVTLLR